jgi:hypothetical protein
MLTSGLYGNEADTVDLRMERGYHIIVSLAIGIVGLILTVTTESAKAKYAGLCILLFGCYVSAPLTVAWLAGNTPGRLKSSIKRLLKNGELS